MAGLALQSVELSAMGGLQQDIDKRVLPADGRWLRAENALMNAKGAWTKRPGYTALSTAIVRSLQTLALPSWIDSTVNGELLAYARSGVDDLPHVYSWSPTANAWADKDDVCPCTAVVEPVSSPYVGAVHPQVAYADTGVRSYAWAVYDDDTSVTGSTVLVTRIEDAATGAVLVDDRKVATQGPLTFAHFGLGDYSATVWGPGPLHLYRVHTTTLIATSILLPGVPATVDRFDACPFENDPARWLLAYVDSTAPGTIVLEERDAAGVVLTSSAIVTGGVVACLSVCARDGVGKAVVFNAGAGVEATVYPDPGGGLGVIIDAGGTAVRIACCIDGNGRIVAVWNGSAGGVTGSVFAKDTDVTGALLGPRYAAVNATLLSRPYSYQGRIYAIASVVRVGAPGHVVCLVCLDKPASAAPYLGTLSGVLSRLGSLLGPIAAAITKQPYGQISTSGDSSVDVALELYEGASVETVSAPKVARARLDFDPSQRCFRGQPAEARGVLHHPGAYVGSYDGISDVEAGFIAAPALTLTADPGGGGIIGGPPPNNTYLYTACYEWTDRAGNVHRSEPSIPKSIALTGPNDAVDIVVTTLCLTRRGDADDGEMRDVTIALFRTTITGQIFYRLLPPKLSETDALVNDKTANTVTFKDVLSDAGLEGLGYGYVYTDGGIASNSPVTTAQASCSWGNRLWLGTGKTLYFSKLFVDGEAPGFNEGLSLTLDDSPDGIRAIAGLGDKLIVWTASRVYYVTGDGPNDTGDPASGGFATRLIATDTGCVDGRSVAVIPAGVMFMSANGIRIVNGAPAVDDIGAPVQDETRGATVVRAVVDSARQRVKFLLDYGTSVGKYVVFDWHMGAWTTEQPYGRTLGDPPVAAPTRPACFTLWQGKWVQSTDYAGVMQEAAATEAGTDAGSYFPMVLETPWFHLAGLGGHTRVWKTTVIGERLAPHTMQLDVFNDYSDAAAVQSRTIDLGGASTVVGLPVVKVAISHKVQQVAAVKVRISDVENGAVTVSPSGYDVAAVRLDVGVEQGSRRLPAANKRLAMGQWSKVGTIGGGVAGGVLTGGNPIGIGIGMAGGGLVGSMLDGNEDLPQVSGGTVAEGTGVYQGPLDQWAAKENAAQGRAAPKTDFSMANADYQRSLEARGMQMDAAGQYKGMLAGDYQSMASLQLQKGQQQAAQTGQNIAASARGGGGAQIMAAQAAQRQAALGSQQTNADAAMLRAKEQETARQGLANLAGQIRQGDFASRQGSQGQAQFLTEAELKQRQMNDQMSSQYLGAQSQGYGQQMQGGIAAQQIQANRDIGAMNANAEIAKANKAADAGFTSGLMSGGFGLAQAGMKGKGA